MKIPTQAEWADPATRAAYLDAAQRERDALRQWNRRAHRRLTNTHRGRAPVPSIGTLRRVRALACIGWSATSLAARVGCSPSTLYNLDDRRHVEAWVAIQVARLYRVLSSTPAPDSTSSKLTRSKAAAAKWDPPAAWDDDDELDDPAARPYRRAAERPLTVREQVLELLALGVTVTEIPGRIGKDWKHIMYAIRDADLRAELRARAIDAGIVQPPAIVTTPRRRRDAA